MANLVRENIKISLKAISSQKLRTALTMLIIAIGILSLVGTLTAIDAIKASINSNFTRMGANTFTIRNKNMTVKIGNQGRGPKSYRQITFDQAVRFSKEYDFPAFASVSTMASGNATVKFESKKTDPNIRIFGGDVNYLATSGYEMDKGRNFSVQEVEYGSPVVILGKEVAQKIFGVKTDPLDKIITIGSGKYKVIGLLKSKGSSMGFGGDKVCILTLNNVRQYFSRPNMSFTINVMADSPQQMEAAISEATGRFRIIRNLPVGTEDDFEITKSDNLANLLIENTQKVTAGATFIGIITLLGAAIGLMNIMLVSVSERTREIGIRKAVGANHKTIRNQFLVEAIVICQLGGLLGIVLSIILGNIFSFLVLEGNFIMPWAWTILGFSICMGVGLISGLYPAVKASRLDPIESLRFE
ncbi:MAG TPA: ABC transporter permease [Bacteroidia bacterium]|jgi:putative ABC transport system permease protein